MVRVFQRFPQQLRRHRVADAAQRFRVFESFLTSHDSSCNKNFPDEFHDAHVAKTTERFHGRRTNKVIAIAQQRQQRRAGLWIPKLAERLDGGDAHMAVFVA